jgi:hypothetical protein
MGYPQQQGSPQQPMGYPQAYQQGPGQQSEGPGRTVGIIVGAISIIAGLFGSPSISWIRRGSPLCCASRLGSR